MKGSRLVLITALSAALSLSLAHAEVSLTVSLGLESGACFEGADIHPTRSVSAEYRRAVENADLHAYVRHAPAGLDCTQDGLTVDIGGKQRWSRNPDSGTGLYAVGEFAAVQIATVGSYSLDGAGQNWIYAVDGAPTYAAALGGGYAWDDFSAQITANAVPTDWYDGESHGARLTLAWEPELLGGDLLLQAVTDSGRRNSGLAQWTRPLDDGPLAVTVTYRYEAGLAELASPFAGAIDAPGGRYLLALGAHETKTLDIGLTWGID